MNPDLFHATTPRQITRQVIFEGALINGINEQGDTALHAVLRRRAPLSVVAELVRLGATVNAQGREGHIPLLLAIYHPDIRVMEFLLDHGALVDGVPLRLAPLHAAVFNDYFDRVELLLARGANVNRTCVRGTTPLFAARSGAMVKRLIEAGANPYKRDLKGQSAMERWQEYGLLEALGALQTKPVLKMVGLHE